MRFKNETGGGRFGHLQRKDVRQSFSFLEEEWEDYGNGDPYILRHDGRYYLYVSTKDHRTGIKAWISDNLVDWRYAGLVTEDPVSTGAYAPEVIYWNGWFYLYTSPAGKGHYVYQIADRPFERISDNVGMSIDGSVFIDDDGSWLFTHAGSSGIVGVSMDGPAEFGVGQTISGPLSGTLDGRVHDYQTERNLLHDLYWQSRVQQRLPHSLCRIA